MPLRKVFRVRLPDDHAFVLHIVREQPGVLFEDLNRVHHIGWNRLHTVVRTLSALSLIERQDIAPARMLFPHGESADAKLLGPLHDKTTARVAMHVLADPGVRVSDLEALLCEDDITKHMLSARVHRLANLGLLREVPRKSGGTLYPGRRLKSLLARVGRHEN